MAPLYNNTRMRNSKSNYHAKQMQYQYTIRIQQTINNTKEMPKKTPYHYRHVAISANSIGQFVLDSARPDMIETNLHSASCQPCASLINHRIAMRPAERERLRRHRNQRKLSSPRRPSSSAHAHSFKNTTSRPTNPTHSVQDSGPNTKNSTKNINSIAHAIA